LKISIITVSYNSEETIQDTFDSIRNQTYNNIEYIVIDGASSDKTVKIIKDNDDIIDKWISETDKGIYDAMNKGISISTGDYVGILNSDDVYINNNVISDVMLNFKRKNTDIVYGNILYVSHDLKKIIRYWKSSGYVYGSFRKGWHPPHPAFFCKRSLYNSHGDFDLELRVAADFDLMLRFFEVHKCSSFHIDKYLTKMRIGGESNNSIKNIIKGNKDVLRSFKKYSISPYPFYPIFRLLPKIREFFRR